MSDVEAGALLFQLLLDGVFTLLALMTQSLELLISDVGAGVQR